MSRHSSPPPCSSPQEISPSPLWEKEAKRVFAYRHRSDPAYRRQSLLGLSIVKLGITTLIRFNLRGQSMTCFDRSRKAFLGEDVEEFILKSPRLARFNLLDLYWIWEGLYEKCTWKEFMETLCGFYSQTWALVRNILASEGFHDLPITLAVPSSESRSLEHLLAAYPATTTQSPFLVQDGKVNLVIPALVTLPSTSSSLDILRSSVTQIQDIWDIDLSPNLYRQLREYMVETGRHALSQRRRDIRERWDLLGFGSAEHRLGVTIQELNDEAWGGDALLHRLTLEVLMEVKPALPLGSIKAVSKTYNSNALQSDFCRFKGLYKNPNNLSIVDADHRGGTLLEAPFNISYTMLRKKDLPVARAWVKDGLRYIMDPLLRGYRDFFDHPSLRPMDRRTCLDTIARPMSSRVPFAYSYRPRLTLDSYVPTSPSPPPGGRSTRRDLPSSCPHRVGRSHGPGRSPSRDRTRSLSPLRRRSRGRSTSQYRGRWSDHWRDESRGHPEGRGWRFRAYSRGSRYRYLPRLRPSSRVCSNYRRPSRYRSRTRSRSQVRGYRNRPSRSRSRDRRSSRSRSYSRDRSRGRSRGDLDRYSRGYSRDRSQDRWSSDQRSHSRDQSRDSLRGRARARYRSRSRIRSISRPQSLSREPSYSSERCSSRSSQPSYQNSSNDQRYASSTPGITTENGDISLRDAGRQTLPLPHWTHPFKVVTCTQPSINSPRTIDSRSRANHEGDPPRGVRRVLGEVDLNRERSPEVRVSIERRPI